MDILHVNDLYGDGRSCSDTSYLSYRSKDSAYYSAVPSDHDESCTHEKIDREIKDSKDQKNQISSRTILTANDNTKAEASSKTQSHIPDPTTSQNVNNAQNTYALDIFSSNDTSAKEERKFSRMRSGGNSLRRFFSRKGKSSLTSQSIENGKQFSKIGDATERTRRQTTNVRDDANMKKEAVLAISDAENDPGELKQGKSQLHSESVELETHEIHELPAVEPVGSELSTPRDGAIEQWRLPVTPLRALFAMTEIRDERARVGTFRPHMVDSSYSPDEQASEPWRSWSPWRDDVTMDKLATTSATATVDSPSYAESNCRPDRLEGKESEIPPRKAVRPKKLQSSDSIDDNGPVLNRRPSFQNSFSSGTTCSDDETDWGEDSESEDFDHEILGSFYNSGMNEAVSAKHGLVQSLTETAKADLVDPIIDEFWTIFNQDRGSGLRQCSPGSSSEAKSVSGGSSTKSSHASETTTSKQSRQTRGDQPSDEDEKSRGSKRPRILAHPSANLDEQLKYACPYRKHDPRRYNVRDWSQCALTPHKTVARVKGHLYRYHIINQCLRCKDLFKSQEELDMHIEAVQGCESKPYSDKIEGITSKIKERLQCRKKAFPGQTEAERWQNIYNILFPKEQAPSPYFDAVQDQHEQSQEPYEPLSGPRDLASYEEYLRCEVPRFIRSALETAVNREVEPIEERLRSQILSLIEDAQNRAFANYRTMHGSPTSETRRQIDEQGPLIKSSSVQPHDPTNVLETYSQLPHQVPPQSTSSFLGFDIPLRRNSTSDSGYASNHPSSGSNADSSFKRTRSNDLQSDPVLPQQGPAVPALSSDEAMAISDELTEDSWMTDNYNTDMNIFDWNDSWSSEWYFQNTNTVGG